MNYLAPAILLLSALIVIFSQPSLAKSFLKKAEKDEVVFNKTGDQEMEMAFKKAQSSAAEFFRLLEKPGKSQSDFSVKIKLQHKDLVEFLWLVDLKKTGKNTYQGIINNEPQYVTGYKTGEKIDFKKDELYDWMYFDNGRMTGNFTACAMLAKEPLSSFNEFYSKFGLECENIGQGFQTVEFSSGTIKITVPFYAKGLMASEDSLYFYIDDDQNYTVELTKVRYIDGNEPDDIAIDFVKLMAKKDSKKLLEIDGKAIIQEMAVQDLRDGIDYRINNFLFGTKRSLITMTLTAPAPNTMPKNLNQKTNETINMIFKSIQQK